jgi:hypothetical protein
VLVECVTCESFVCSSVDFWWYIPRMELAFIKDLNCYLWLKKDDRVYPVTEVDFSKKSNHLNIHPSIIFYLSTRS